jgi:hypothetical protein
MLNLRIPGLHFSFALTDKNESDVKEKLSHFPPETLITIIELKEVERLDTIFNYDINHKEA